jgi:hypothetical protein
VSRSSSNCTLAPCVLLHHLLLALLCRHSAAAAEASAAAAAAAAPKSTMHAEYVASMDQGVPAVDVEAVVADFAPAIAVEAEAVAAPEVTYAPVQDTLAVQETHVAAQEEAPEPALTFSTAVPLIPRGQADAAASSDDPSNAKAADLAVYERALLALQALEAPFFGPRVSVHEACQPHMHACCRCSLLPMMRWPSRLPVL